VDRARVAATKALGAEAVDAALEGGRSLSMDEAFGRGADAA